MKLSSRIAALTGPDREIDVEIADLFGFWPPGYQEIVGNGWRRLNRSCLSVLDCPNYTANIMHVCDECEKRGWALIVDMGFEQVLIDVWEAPANRLSHVCRDSARPSNIEATLAACEALVRAVENNSTLP